MRVIDFGVATMYSRTKNELESTTPSHFVGTVSFAPRASHLNQSQSANSDLESLCYTLLFVRTGDLPWKGHPKQLESEQNRFSMIERFKSVYINNIQQDNEDNDYVRKTPMFIRKMLKHIVFCQNSM